MHNKSFLELLIKYIFNNSLQTISEFLADCFVYFQNNAISICAIIYMLVIIRILLKDIKIKTVKINKQTNK